MPYSYYSHEPETAMKIRQSSNSPFVTSKHHNTGLVREHSVSSPRRAP
jgi:hypothetical protein